MNIDAVAAAAQADGADGAAHDGAAGGPGRRRPAVLSRMTGSVWFNLAAAFVVLALLQAFVVRAYQVPSGSMEPTLQVGDRILVNRLAYLSGGPHDGDVVVFAAPGSWGGSSTPSDPMLTAVLWAGDVFGIGPGLTHTLVKRVIGAPGQTVSCCDVQGRVTVNGHPLDERYLGANLPFIPGELDCATTTRSPRCFGPLTVPAGDYLVLGDNRADSSDSVVTCRGRDPTAGCARYVPAGAIIGQVVWRILPHWGGVAR